MSNRQTTTRTTSRLTVQRAVLLALVTFVVTVALTTVAVGPVQADDPPPLATIDDNHSLDCSEFQTTGRTLSNHSVPAVTVTVAKHPSQVGLPETLTGDATHHYIRIEYHEDRDRTLRIWIPEDCLNPYAKEPVESVTGGPPAEYSIVEQNGTRYLGVRVVVTTETDTVYRVSRGGGVSFGVLDRVTEQVGGVLGLGGGNGSQWNYINSTELEGTNATARIALEENESDPLIQYRTGNDTWAVVPDEPDHPAPVYSFRKSGVNNTVYITSEVDDAPTVRWTTEKGGTTLLEGIGSDIGHAVSEMGKDVNQFLEWAFPENSGFILPTGTGVA